MILDEIVKKKRASLELREKKMSLSALVQKCTPTDRSFLKALSGDEIAFILECKRASPSNGVIRKNYDPVAIAKAYSPFANAISVLTDRSFFGGSFEHLRSVRENVDLPVLCKDFVLSPYQVYEARLNGADAILLMMSILDDVTFLLCRHAAYQLNMEVLVEAHTEEEAKRARKLDCQIIGINNRDLKTLNVDLQTTEKISPLLSGASVLVSESGISRHDDLIGLRSQADAFLVGSSLMRNDRIDLAVRELIFGRVKVCGLTSSSDAFDAYSLGASYGGLIFAKESKRCVTLDSAREIRSQVPLNFVGVFVNEDLETVERYTKELSLFAVQLHGEESPQYVEALHERLGGFAHVWKTVHLEDGGFEQLNARMEPYLSRTNAIRFLIDSKIGHQRGGTGHAWDFTELHRLMNAKDIIVSGGIGPDNCELAMRQMPFMLDVNSKVESEPGKKDREKLKDLFAILRGRRTRRMRV